MKLAVDVGYGYVKALSSEGGKVCFPSAAAPAAADPLAGALGGGPGHRVSVRAGPGPARERLVGEAALRNAAAGEAAAREKPAALHDLLVLAAAYLLGAGSAGVPAAEKTELAVGLPLAYYRAQKDALRKRLSALGAWAAADGGPERWISFSRVLILPQGAGAALAEAPRLPEGLVGVVDVGTVTTDYLLLEVRNGRPVPLPDACGSVEAGARLVAQALAAEFHAQTGAPLPPWAEREALARAVAGRPLRFAGREVDLSAAFRAAVRDAGAAIAQRVLAAWGSRAAFVEATVLAGGGALLFREELARALPCAVLAEDPLFANCRGYLAALDGGGGEG